ncbi:MAG: 6-bladed beta-propeller [Thiohalospira sp.]
MITKKRLYIIGLLLIVLIDSCKHSNREQNYLIKNDIINFEARDIKASELLGSNIRYIQLDSIGANKIGRVNKIVKRNQNFYILSDDKRIFQFDTMGRFISLLNKPGKGPEEYSRIEDFDIYMINGKPQLWLSDFSKIKIYEYNINWELDTIITFPYVVNKFKRLKNGNILLMTGQNEKTLTLVDAKGEVVKTFLEKQIPFLTLKSVQFIANDSLILFPLGVANEYVSFNQKTEEFGYGNFIKTNDLISKNELLELYEQKGFDFYGDLKEKIYLNNIRFLKEKIIVQFNKRGERYIAVVVNKDEEVLSSRFMPNSTIIDDITPQNNSKYFKSFLYGDSDNSLIFLQNPESSNDGIAIIDIS